MPIELKASFSAELFFVSGDEMAPGGRVCELAASCQVMGEIALQKALDHEEQIRQHRVNEQLLVARDIQRHYLPSSLPGHPDLSIAGRSLPALFVGGDYFDALEMENGEILALIADVSGKGIQGAIRMAGLRAILHSLPWENLTPGEALERLNQYLNRDAMAGQFITACCVSFCHKGASFKLATAGHDPAILIGGGGTVTELECPGGLPLGIRPDQSYPVSEIPWQTGDKLLLYTDGITDTRNDKRDQFGIERVTANFIGSGDRSPEQDLEHLFATLEGFRGKAPWADDLTMMTFKHL
jgi:serine phosphatase RsbU (regulator of sigma subunit)